VHWRTKMNDYVVSVCLCILACAMPISAYGGTDNDRESKMKQQTTIHIVPQSHIDVVWLWRYDPETIHRCCKPTFTRAADNLDQFPEYTFNASQVPLYDATEQHYPRLFEKMKQHIREGRWEIVGGMYVEAEGGEPCGEALVRQCVMGKRYWRQKFGIDVTTGWQEDAWSHPWQLPQILAKTGINAYMFLRGEKGDQLFWWQAPDGSKVLAVNPFFMDLPPRGKRPEAVISEAVDTIRTKYGIHDVMAITGGGDHGGGLSAEHIKVVLDLAKRSAPDTEIRFNTFSRYAKTILDQEPKLPTLNDELGFQLQGDLTGCCEIKKNNRECENLLLTAEKWASIATAQFEYEYPEVELEDAWRKLLFNQFHDVLGGSAIPPAVIDAMQQYLSVRESCAFITSEALKAITDRIDTTGEGIPLVVFNPLSWTRSGPVEFEIESRDSKEPQQAVKVKDARGHETPAHILERRVDGKKQVLRGVFVANGVPSLGYKIYHALPAGPAEIQEPPQRHALENELYRVEIDPHTGYISRLLDKMNNRECLAAEAKGNMLIAIDDDGDSEGRFVLGHDCAPFPPGVAREIMTEPSIKLVEDNPVRTSLRVERAYQNSRFTQEICLYHGIPRVDFRLIVDWHETHKMIKVAFPLDLKNPQVTYDAPYATIVRPADGNEYPAQKWIDLYADGYGVALLNNCRYAHDVKEGTVRMSILRSPTRPACNTEEGVHIVDYAIIAHKGPWQENHVMRAGYEFNFPMKAVPTAQHGGPLPAEISFFSLEPENVLLEVVKKAYDSDDLILRLCETNGKPCTARVTASAALESCSEADLLENKTGGGFKAGRELEIDIKPCEIKTITGRLGRLPAL